MRHQKSGRQLGRNTPHRLAMFKNMANSIITMEQVQTTVPKAKELRRIVDRLITIGKKGTESARKVAYDRTRDRFVVEKLFGELAKRYATRNGGYSRVLRVSDTRRGDGAEMAVLELMDHPVLDRKRTTNPEQAEKNKTEAQAAGSTDPYKWMRKSFAGSKFATPGSAKASGSASAAKTKKAPKTLKGPKPERAKK
jgi:large subunit ribosomal protein L17